MVEPTDPQSKPSGISGLFRRFGRTVTGAVHTRLELLSVELQEEKQRLVELLAWTAAVIFFAVLAVLCITMAIVLACPESARPWVLGGLGIVYAVLAWRGVVILRGQLRNRPLPLAGTVGELKKDAEWMRPKN